MFATADALAINKYDMKPHFDFDDVRVADNARGLNPKLEIFPLSARSGEGMEAFILWLSGRIAAAIS